MIPALKSSGFQCNETSPKFAIAVAMSSSSLVDTDSACWVEAQVTYCGVKMRCALFEGQLSWYNPLSWLMVEVLIIQ